MKPHLKFLIATPVGWLLKALEIAVVAFGLVIGMYDPAIGTGFSIESHIDPESLTIGDKFLYVNSINIEDGCTIEPLPLGERLGDALVLSPIFQIEKTPDSTVSFACTLSVYRPGEIEIPTFKYIVTDSTENIQEVSGETLKATIHSVLPADTTGLEIADIREPRRLRGPIWPYIIVPLVLALLILAGMKLRQYMRKSVDVPQAPPRPPWEIALERLDTLRGKRHIEFGKFKQYYFELSLIVRGYIEGRYNFPAVESTTIELENEIILKIVDDHLYARLFEFFNRADTVKFAKAVPTEGDAESDILFAHDFITRTIPSVDEPDAGDRVTETAAN